MRKKVTALAMEYDMLPRGERVLCAVSGGADSMCLLHLLLSLAPEGGFQVAAAHFDHRLRGDESAGDADFVARWCSEHGVPCAVGGGDVAAEAKRLSLGVEETARRLRYAFLRESAERLGCSRIATAHSADDNAETLLLHLARGTGLQGLAGIPPRRGEIVRPLLTCTRAEILAYLDEHRIPHREDASNADEAYSRNKLRARVIPVLRELNPRFTESVSETVRYLRADNDYLNAQAQRACLEARWAEEDLVIRAAVIADLPAAVAPRAVRRLLEMTGDGNTDCTAAHLNAVVELARGDDPSAMVCLPGGRLVQRVYRELLFTTRSDTPAAFACVPVALDGETPVPGGSWSLCCRAGRCPEGAEQSRGHFWVARDRCGRLVLRPRQTGDSISLPGRGGTKTLKKLFIDEKIPRREREQIPVLADEAGVVAVAGFGPDRGRLAAPGEEAYELRLILKQKE